MANCLTCIHQEVCRERMEIFNLPNIACQYEAHELVGEWIVIHNALGETKYKCNKCQHYANPSNDKNFCSNCGADMRVKDELNRVSKELKEGE